MPVYTTELKVNKIAVIRGLGYKEIVGIESQTLSEITAEIGAVKAILNPRVIYTEYPVSADYLAQRFILPQGALFPGKCVFERLCQADSLLIAVATIGEITNMVESTTAGYEDLFSVFLRDVIGTVALYELQQSFWQSQTLLAAKQEKGVTGLFCPGDGEWDIKEQGTLFANINASSIDVSINQHWLMSPLKSVSMVCGVGTKITTPQREHECSNCASTICSYRYESEIRKG